MKSTTYFAEISKQKAEKYLSVKRKLESTCLLACSPRANKAIFRVSLLKTVLPFLTNQAAWFISRGIDQSYFSQNLLLSFILWYNSRFKLNRGEGVHFYVSHRLLTFDRSNFFFNWKLNISSFIFLIWPEQF